MWIILNRLGQTRGISKSLEYFEAKITSIVLSAEMSPENRRNNVRKFHAMEYIQSSGQHIFAFAAAFLY